MKDLPAIVFVASISFFVGTLLYARSHFFPFIAIGKPTIVCDQPVQDLGNVSDADPVICKFTIRNVGNRQLIIRNVSTGCGACVKVVSFPKEAILPSKDGAVEVKLLTDRLRRQLSHEGFVIKSIAVMSNDPERPALVLRLRAQVRPSEAPDENPVGPVAVESLRESSDVIGSEENRTAAASPD